MRKTILPILMVSSLVFVGCENQNEQIIATKEVNANAYENFTFEAKPETFEVNVIYNGQKEIISEPQSASTVANLKKTNKQMSWDYPDKKLSVTLEKKKDYLDVTIHSNKKTTSDFTWPMIHADHYTLPIAEGKYFSSQDKAFREFYKDDPELDMAESFSMRFIAANKKKFAVSYIQDNNDDDTLEIGTDPDISFKVNHQFASINKQKTNHYRIYLTDNNPVSIAKNYRQTLIDDGKYKTLAEKAKKNPEIKKLYGAPHIYLWNSRILSEDDLNWSKLKDKLNQPLFKKMTTLLDNNSEDGSSEYQKALSDLKAGKGYKYEKNVLLTALNTCIQYPGLYDAKTFPHPDKTAKKYIKKGIENLNEQERYDLNKHLIASVLASAALPVDKWGEKNATSIIQDMKNNGINHAWIGLPNWVNGLWNPTFVKTATDDGYLIGPYDSYQSIQQNASIDWNTASFPDASLYEKATVENENGEKVKGFLGKGRKLNPTVIQSDVKQRVNGILSGGISFNSWFMDVDAAGEIYNDYSKKHPTTKAEDIAARMKRLDFLDDKNLVVGSEGGNDYAAEHIAFAHGIETPVIKWSDPDMRKNKESKYFIGSYASMDGSIPTRYSESVPIKDEYKSIYTDPIYSVPLFKLVYNDSVITSHHWEWDSYKIKGQTGERRLKEYLYNTPPLFHLDAPTWKKRKQDILQNLKTWQPFQEAALKHQMTNFEVLTSDRLVQKTTFGKDLSVTANFGSKTYEGIKPQTAVIQMDGKKTVIDTKDLD